MEETKNEGILTSLGLQVTHSPVASSLIPLGHSPKSGSKGSHPSPLSFGTEDDGSRAKVSKGKSEKEVERQTYLLRQGSQYKRHQSMLPRSHKSAAAGGLGS